MAISRDGLRGKIVSLRNQCEAAQAAVKADSKKDKAITIDVKHSAKHSPKGYSDVLAETLARLKTIENDIIQPTTDLLKTNKELQGISIFLRTKLGDLITTLPKPLGMETVPQKEAPKRPPLPSIFGYTISCSMFFDSYAAVQTLLKQKAGEEGNGLMKDEKTYTLRSGPAVIWDD